MPTQPKTPEQLAGTALASLRKSTATPERLEAAVRSLYWRWWADAPNKPQAEVAFYAANAPIQGPNGPLVPSETGMLMVAASPDDNAPTAKNGAWIMRPGNSLLTTQPITAVERTLWLVVRRTGNPALVDQGTHRIIDHGRDMALMALADGTFWVCSPSPGNDANCGCNAGKAFDYTRMDTAPKFGPDWQVLTIRYKPGMVCLSVNGQDFSRAVKGSDLPRTEPLRMGQYENGFGGMHGEVAAYGMSTRYWTDEEVRGHEARLKTRLKL